MQTSREMKGYHRIFSLFLWLWIIFVCQASDYEVLVSENKPQVSDDEPRLLADFSPPI